MKVYIAVSLGDDGRLFYRVFTSFGLAVESHPTELIETTLEGQIENLRPEGIVSSICDRPDMNVALRWNLAQNTEPTA